MAEGSDHPSNRAGSRPGRDVVYGWQYPSHGPPERMAERPAEPAASVRGHPSPDVLQQVSSRAYIFSVPLIAATSFSSPFLPVCFNSSGTI